MLKLKLKIASTGHLHFSFPKNPDILKEWVTKIRRVDPGTRRAWEPSQYSVLCSEHFEASDFALGYGGYGGKRLKPTAVPSIFAHSRPVKHRKEPHPRSAHAEIDTGAGSSMTTHDTTNEGSSEVVFESLDAGLSRDMVKIVPVAGSATVVTDFNLSTDMVDIVSGADAIAGCSSWSDTANIDPGAGSSAHMVDIVMGDELSMSMVSNSPGEALPMDTTSARISGSQLEVFKKV